VDVARLCIDGPTEVDVSLLTNGASNVHLYAYGANGDLFDSVGGFYPPTIRLRPRQGEGFTLLTAIYDGVPVDYQLEVGTVSVLLVGEVHTGGSTSCTFVGDGLRCWGHDAETLVADAPAATLTMIAVGAGYLCGLDPAGELTCWGPLAPDGTPTGTFSTLSASVFGQYSHACALRPTGEPACWGSNNFGQLDAPARLFRRISAGYLFTCAIDEAGALACWGGRSGEEVLLVPEGRFREVVAATDFACAVPEEGEGIRCWGDPDRAGRPISEAPMTGTYARLTAGSYGACALDAAGALVCWGGHAADDDRPSDPTFIDVSSSGYHTCAVRSDGVILCWGDNYYGESDPP